MSESKDRALKLTNLRYEMLPLLFEQMQIDEADTVSRILKCHLLSEVVLDKLLTLALAPNGEAVLSVKLSYINKVNIASRSVLTKNYELLPDVVVGSLKELNKIRNKLAHELGATVTHEEALKLFNGMEYPVPLDPETTDTAMIIRHYTACIFGYMLPKYEVIDDV